MTIEGGTEQAIKRARPNTGPVKLPSLDLGRFVAALLVTMFHATFTVINFGGRPPFDGVMRGGHAGVEYFFVLSGFIIYYAHQGDLNRSGTLLTYLRKRATRILPMLWLVLVAWGAMRIIFAGETTRDSTGLSTLILDMLLLPHKGPLVLGVTWTLQRELVFYILFATALINKRIGFAILAIWQLSIIVATILQIPLGPWGQAVFNVYNLGFGVGLLIAGFHNRLKIGKPMVLAGIGLALFSILLVTEYLVGGPLNAEFRPLGQTTSPLFYTFAAAICLLGLVAYDQKRRKRASWLVATLGGCSYVLYLVHGPVGSLLVRIISRLHLGSEIEMILLTLIPILVAIALHLWVEKPILRALRPKPRPVTPGNAGSPPAAH